MEPEYKYIGPRITATINLKNPLLFLSIPDSKRVFIVRTDFRFTYFRELESLHETEPAAIKSITANNFEMFACHYEELRANVAFYELKKRRLLQPVNIMYKSTE